MNLQVPNDPPENSPMAKHYDEKIIESLEILAKLLEEDAPAAIFMSRFAVLSRALALRYPTAYAQAMLLPVLENLKEDSGWCYEDGCGHQAIKDSLFCEKHHREASEEEACYTVEVNIAFFNTVGKEIKAYLWGKGYNDVGKLCDLYPEQLRDLMGGCEVALGYEIVKEALDYYR